jgi:hypothetical protein
LVHELLQARRNAKIFILPMNVSGNLTASPATLAQQY